MIHPLNVRHRLVEADVVAGVTTDVIEQRAIGVSIAGKVQRAILVRVTPVREPAIRPHLLADGIAKGIKPGRKLHHARIQTVHIARINGSRQHAGLPIGDAITCSTITTTRWSR